MLLQTAITKRLIELMGQCTPAFGRESNVGTRVICARYDSSRIEAPMSFVYPGSQSIDASFPQLRFREIEIRGFVDLTAVDVWREAAFADRDLIECGLIDEIIEDIRACMETHDEQLMALVDSFAYVDDKPGYADDGSTLIGASVTYRVGYAPDPNDPSNPVS